MLYISVSEEFDPSGAQTNQIYMMPVLKVVDFFGICIAYYEKQEESHGHDQAR